MGRDTCQLGAMLLLLLVVLQCAEADIVVLDKVTNATVSFDSAPASFGSFAAVEPGALVEIHPRDACHPNITKPPNSHDKFVAVVSRGGCSFILKVLNAQLSNYVGVIVVNYENGDLIVMGGQDSDIVIPSVLTTHKVAQQLRPYYYHVSQNYTVTLDTRFNQFNWHSYLVPFVIVVSICLVLMGVFMLIRYRRERRQVMRRRLPVVDLKQIPIIKFKKDEESRYETCAICLDDYEDGDKLRVLPCQHAYHCQCIDKWLVTRSRACPVCKTKVNKRDSDSDSDSSSTPPRRRSGAAAASALEDDDSSDSGTGESVPLVRGLDRSGGLYGSHDSSISPIAELASSPPQAAASAAPSQELTSNTTAAQEEGSPSPVPVVVVNQASTTGSDESLV